MLRRKHNQRRYVADLLPRSTGTHSGTIITPADVKLHACMTCRTVPYTQSAARAQSALRGAPTSTPWASCRACSTLALPTASPCTLSHSVTLRDPLANVLTLCPSQSPTPRLHRPALHSRVPAHPNPFIHHSLHTSLHTFLRGLIPSATLSSLRCPPLHCIPWHPKPCATGYSTAPWCQPTYPGTCLNASSTHPLSSPWRSRTPPARRCARRRM